MRGRSRLTDHAAHINDLSAHLHEILMYNEMVQYVYDFAQTHPNTVVISVRRLCHCLSGDLERRQS